MKKLIALFVIFICVGTALSAQMSVGGGGLFSTLYKSYSYVAGNHYLSTRYINGGGFVFFDATFVEVDLGIRFGVDTRSRFATGVSEEAKKAYARNATF